jgi:predicted acyltransferase
MIVVNNPGNWNSVFPQLTHAAWHGVTGADLIFPMFVFIMGVAMAFALSANDGTTVSRAQRYRRIARRAAVLVLLGLLLNVTAAWPHPGAMRIPGVLQRIGITYFAAAAIVVDTDVAQQITIACGLLLFHWAVLVIPIVGSAGSLEPGRNIQASIDRALFGSHTLTPAGDPEGALGLLSCVATALLGVVVGRWVLRATAGADISRSRSRWLLPKLTLVGLGTLGLALAWSDVLPLNKALWTPSFALLTGAVSMLSLVGAALVARPAVPRGLAPFAWLGTNPLVVYFLSELTTNVIQRPWLTIGARQVALKEWFFWSALAPRMGDNGGEWSSLVYALLYTGVWICVAGGLKLRRVRVSV